MDTKLIYVSRIIISIMLMLALFTTPLMDLKRSTCSKYAIGNTGFRFLIIMVATIMVASCFMPVIYQKVTSLSMLISFILLSLLMILTNIFLSSSVCPLYYTIWIIFYIAAPIIYFAISRKINQQRRNGIDDMYRQIIPEV